MAHAVPARLTAAEGRRFAFTVGGAFAVLAGVAWWRGRMGTALPLATLATLLALAGVLVPSRLGPVNRAWMGLAAAISKVTTPIFMGVIFFLVITPIGLLLRVVGRAPLRPPRRGASHWHPRGEGDRRSDLARQF